MVYWYTRAGATRSLVAEIGWLGILFSVTLSVWKKGARRLGQIFFVLFLVHVLETTCFVLRGAPVEPPLQFTVAQYPEGHLARYVGPAPYSDSIYHRVKTIDNEVVYDVHCSIDRYHRRVVPEHDTTRTHYALFFGCSVAFGDGLDDDRTFPFYFQHHAPGYNSYIYAYSGWGPHQMLGRLLHHDLSQEIPEREGLAVYVFIWSHLRRAIGDMYTYCNWGYQDPQYTLDDGRAVRHGNFTDDRPVRSWLYRQLYGSNALRYFGLNAPLWLAEDDLELSAELIARSRDLYRTQFHNDRFIVLIWPGSVDGFPEALRKSFLAKLDARGLRVLDESCALRLDPSMSIPHDGHPTARLTDAMATIAARDLGVAR